MIDLTDRKILALLQEDAGLSVSDVAERVGMSAPPCWRRIRRLKDEGFLDRQVWLAAPEKLDLGLLVYATVKLAAHDRKATSAFREHVAKLPEVLECYVLLGGIDVLIKVRVPDIKYYETFFYDRLSQLPGVREVNSSVVLTQVKSTTALPTHLSTKKSGE